MTIVTEKFLKGFSTRSNEDVWVAKGYSRCEVIAAVLGVTLPVHKLMLLRLKRK